MAALVAHSKLRHFNHRHTSLIHPSNSPQKEPYNMNDPTTTSILEFYAYGGPLPSDGISDAFKDALSKALAHPHDSLIDSEKMEFWGGAAQLILYPGEEMTWIMWAKALWLMRDFVFEKGMAFEWQYIVLDPGLADVGWGALMNGVGGKGQTG